MLQEEGKAERAGGVGSAVVTVICAFLLAGIISVLSWSPAFAGEYTEVSSENPTVESFISKIGPDAQMIAQENDLYASVMIAQAIIESASGTSGLGKAPNWNLFGIKGKGNAGGVSFSTKEDDGTGNYYTIVSTFRKYDSWKASLEDYANLLKRTSFYRGAWKSNTGSYRDATRWLEGRYATSTNYSSTLNSTIEMYNLTRWDEPIPYGIPNCRVTSVISECLKGGKWDSSYEWLQDLFQDALGLDLDLDNDLMPLDDLHNLRVGDILVDEDGNYGVSAGNGYYFYLQNEHPVMVSLDNRMMDHAFRYYDNLTPDERHDREVREAEQMVLGDLRQQDQEFQEKLQDLLGQVQQ